MKKTYMMPCIKVTLVEMESLMAGLSLQDIDDSNDTFEGKIDPSISVEEMGVRHEWNIFD